MIDRSFWTAEPLPKIAFLADLRDFVLERSHSRLPKWRFRPADDLVMQIQPKPGERRDRYFVFAGRALQGANLAAAMFQSRSAARGTYDLDFGILADGEAWALKPTGAGWPSTDEDREDRLLAFRARVLSELRADRFGELTPAMMLSPACLICGRALTDPASIARWIGPECAGTASLIVPRTVELAAGGGR